MHATLQQAARLMTSDIQFDPSSTQRQFSLRMSDLVGTLVLPALMARVDAAAPGLAIDTVHLSPEQTIEALEADRLDLAVSMELQAPARSAPRPCSATGWCACCAGGTCWPERRLTLKQFLAYRHVRVSMSPPTSASSTSVLAG